MGSKGHCSEAQRGSPYTLRPLTEVIVGAVMQLF